MGAHIRIAEAILESHNNLDVCSFLLGYYSHLITDKEWGKMFQKKIDSDSVYDGLETDKNLVWTIKKDWYDLDHLYFKKNPSSIFHNVFKNIDSVPDYLEYYPNGAIERQIKYISNFYASYEGNPIRVYRYLTEIEMDSFVKKHIRTDRKRS